MIAPIQKSHNQWIIYLSRTLWSVGKKNQKPVSMVFIRQLTVSLNRLRFSHLHDLKTKHFLYRGINMRKSAKLENEVA